MVFRASNVECLRALCLPTLELSIPSRFLQQFWISGGLGLKFRITQ